MNTYDDRLGAVARSLEEKMKHLIDGYEYLENVSNMVPEAIQTLAEQHRRNLSVVAETLESGGVTSDAVEDHIHEARQALNSITNDRIALRVSARRIAHETKENIRFNAKKSCAATPETNKCSDRIPLPVYQSAIKTAEPPRAKKSSPLPPSVRHVSSRSRVVPAMRSGAATAAIDLLLQLDAQGESRGRKKRSSSKSRKSGRSRSKGSSEGKQVAALRKEMQELITAFRMNQERNDAALGAEIQKQWQDVQSRVMDLIQQMLERQHGSNTLSPDQLTALVKKEMASMWQTATGDKCEANLTHPQQSVVEEVVRHDLQEKYRVITPRKPVAHEEREEKTSDSTDNVRITCMSGEGRYRDALCGDEHIISGHDIIENADYILVVDEDGHLQWEPVTRGGRASSAVIHDDALLSEELSHQKQEQWLSAGIGMVHMDGEQDDDQSRGAHCDHNDHNSMHCPVSLLSPPALIHRDADEALTTALRYQSRVVRRKAKTSEDDLKQKHPDVCSDNNNNNDDEVVSEEQQSVSSSPSRENVKILPGLPSGDPIAPHDKEISSPAAPTSSISIVNYAERESHLVNHSLLDAIKTLILSQQQSMQDNNNIWMQLLARQNATPAHVAPSSVPGDTCENAAQSKPDSEPLSDNDIAIEATSRKTMKSAIGDLLKHGDRFGDASSTVPLDTSGVGAGDTNKWISSALEKRVQTVSKSESSSPNDGAMSAAWLNVANRAVEAIQGWQQQIPLQRQEQVSVAAIESAVVRAVENALGEQKNSMSTVPAPGTGVVLLNTKRSTASHGGQGIGGGGGRRIASLSHYVERDLDACRTEAKHLLEEASFDCSSCSSVDSSALPISIQKYTSREMSSYSKSSDMCSGKSKPSKEVWFNADNELPRPLYSRVLDCAATEEHFSPTSRKESALAKRDKCDDAAYSRFIEPTLVRRQQVQADSSDESVSFASHVTDPSVDIPSTRMQRIMRRAVTDSHSSFSSSNDDTASVSLVSWSTGDASSVSGSASVESNGIFSASVDSSVESRGYMRHTSSSASSHQSSNTRSSGSSRIKISARGRDVKLDRTKLRLWRP